jgi:cell division protein FtsL
MEPRLSLSAARFALSVRLEPKSEVADKKADRPLGRRDTGQPARSLGEAARGGEDLRDNHGRYRHRVRPPRVDRAGGRRRFVVVAFFALALIGTVLVHVWLRLQVVHMGYVLSSASKLQSRLEQENRELKIELATMTSPDRLESLARRRLGLKPPEKGQIIVLP